VDYLYIVRSFFFLVNIEYLTYSLNIYNEGSIASDIISLTTIIFLIMDCIISLRNDKFDTILISSKF